MTITFSSKPCKNKQLDTAQINDPKDTTDKLVMTKVRNLHTVIEMPNGLTDIKNIIS